MISILETCDGCGATRNLLQVRDEENGGWRKVTTTKHLCHACISKAVGHD